MRVKLRLRRGKKLPGKGPKEGLKKCLEKGGNFEENAWKMRVKLRLRRGYTLPGKGLQKGSKKCLEKRGKLCKKCLVKDLQKYV